MKTYQKVIKYCTMAFAILLIASIIGGILGAVGTFFGLSGSNGVNEEISSFEISQDIKSLDLDINAANFYLIEGESFSVESNLKYIEVKEQKGTLVIKETRSHNVNYDEPVLKITIPKGFVFGYIDIFTGAGRFNADLLSAETVSLSLGAGEVNIKSLNASKEADIEGGAGELVVLGGTIYNLELEMGVGKLNLTSALRGECDLDYGVGEALLTLVGNKDDYKIKVEKGIGSISVEGIDVENGSVIGNGKTCIDIEGGIGSSKITFKGE